MENVRGMHAIVVCGFSDVSYTASNEFESMLTWLLLVALFQCSKIVEKLCNHMVINVSVRLSTAYL